MYGITYLKLKYFSVIKRFLILMKKLYNKFLSTQGPISSFSTKTGLELKRFNFGNN
jgi:hypothetical protein